MGSGKADKARVWPGAEVFCSLLEEAAEQANAKVHWITDGWIARIDKITGHLASVVSAAFSSDGKTLATISDDRTFRLWDVRNPARTAPIGQPIALPVGSKYSVAFSPNRLVGNRRWR